MTSTEVHHGDEPRGAAERRGRTTWSRLSRRRRSWAAAAVVVCSLVVLLVWRSTASSVVLEETGNGPELRPYASTDLNGQNPLWHVEPGSTGVDRAGGRISKVGDEQFHRMFSTERLGGPGKALTIRYRARATDIRDREGSSIIEGVKLGLRFPSPLAEHGKDDPRSAYGTGGEPDSPGSYQFLTGLTEGGYIELIRNGYGEEGYTTFPNISLGYTPGTWLDVVIVVEWRLDESVRVRYWHSTTTDGPPVYEAVDEESPFASEPGFLWLRSDDTDWEYDYLVIEERDVERIW